MLGTQFYLQHPAWPLERTVADLEVEMIGRPDSLAGGPGKLWLTGYERSTMGEELAAAGLPVVADPRPEQNFFLRSDNIVFAIRGIPAHTLSSYNMHRDYHQPGDEVARSTRPPGARAELVSRAVRLLADGDPPRWHPGGAHPDRPLTMKARELGRSSSAPWQAGGTTTSPASAPPRILHPVRHGPDPGRSRSRSRASSSARRRSGARW